LNSLNRLQPFALLVMRLVLGAIMIAHGYKKVFGGFHAHQQFVGSLGIPAWMAYLSTATEFFGGIAIVLGLFTCKSALEKWLYWPWRLRIPARADHDCVCPHVLRRRAIRLQRRTEFRRIAQVTKKPIVIPKKPLLLDGAALSASV
jgi:hypothetical protein